jgi:hypothetical protein
MSFSGARMRGADLVRAQMHDTGLHEGGTKGIKLTLSQITQLDPIGLGKTKRVPCPHLIGIEPGTPDDYVVGLGGSVFMQVSTNAGWQ